MAVLLALPPTVPVEAGASVELITGEVAGIEAVAVPSSTVIYVAL